MCKRMNLCLPVQLWKVQGKEWIAGIEKGHVPTFGFFPNVTEGLIKDADLAPL